MTTETGPYRAGPSVTEERVREQFKSIVSSDFLHLACGEWLGGGVGRGVYECRFNPGVVFKIELPSQSFQNVAEWEAWSELKYLKLAIRKWFAPCLSISPCGIVMAQARTTPLVGELPKRLPEFFTDVKRSNFGMYHGQVVAHDYGLSNMLSHGLTSKLQTAEWSDK